MKRPLLALLLPLTIHAAQAQSNTARLDSLMAAGSAQYNQKQYQTSIGTYEAALRQPGIRPRMRVTAHYNMACDYALLGDAARAHRALQQAVRAGWTNDRHLAQDSDLNLLHGTAQWDKLLARVRRAHEAKIVRRAEDVKLVTTDVKNFWAAYPAAMRDTAQAAQVFRQLYFDKATEGLQDYYAAKIRNDRRFVKGLYTKPQFYASIRPTTLAVDAQKPQIMAAFRRFQELYPAVQFHHVYFVIGGFRSGGTTSETGLLIGLDQSANGPGVNTAELSLWARNNCGQVTNLDQLLVHELVHNNQGPYGNTLLQVTLNEGMADFVAELVTGKKGTAERLHRYGNAHEKELWAAFKQEMDGTNASNWIANGSQETPERPCDLGYYLGYKICEAYYNRAADKKQALADILNIKDHKDFLARSGYEQALAAR